MLAYARIAYRDACRGVKSHSSHTVRIPRIPSTPQIQICSAANCAEKLVFFCFFSSFLHFLYVFFFFCFLVTVVAVRRLQGTGLDIQPGGFGGGADVVPKQTSSCHLPIILLYFAFCKWLSCDVALVSLPYFTDSQNLLLFFCIFTRSHR